MGYDRNPKNKAELAVNESEAASVRKIFEVFLEQETVRKTQAAITELGIRNKTYTNKHGIEKGGKAFSVDTLQSLLTNKAYIGIKELRHKDGSSEDIKAVWPAIIDKDIFQKVQERLSKNKNRYKPESWKVYPFTLTELVQCGECGKSLGGKSGTGRKEKHHYYGHAQIKNPFTKETAHQCQVKNVRAPRLEEIITKSLRNLLNDPSLIEKWIEIYRSKTSSELPEVENRTKLLDQEIQNVTKKISNLVQRVADLPAEIPADPFYEQIKQLNQKLTEAKLAKEKLRTKEMDLYGQDIDQDGLKAKIERTLQNLDNAPKEKQRPILTNLVKFIEIHPMKIKIGMYAPSKEQYKATGTDGAPSPGNKAQNLNEIKEGKLIPFSPNRVGSSTVVNGAPGPRVCEHPRILRSGLNRFNRSSAGTTSKRYSVRWKEPQIDVAELARLRFLDGWNFDELAKRYNRPAITIGNWCRRLRFDEFCHRTISLELRNQLIEADSRRRSKNAGL